MDQLWQIVLTAVGTIITGLATWLTVRLTTWLNEKIKDKQVARWSTAILNIIMTAVQTVQQTFVDTLKKAGKFDKDAADMAKKKAYDIITRQLTAELKTYIEDNFGDMRDYIMNQIEAIINQLYK